MNSVIRRKTLPGCPQHFPNWKNRGLPKLLTGNEFGDKAQNPARLPATLPELEKSGLPSLLQGVIAEPFAKLKPIPLRI